MYTNDNTIGTADWADVEHDNGQDIDTIFELSLEVIRDDAKAAETWVEPSIELLFAFGRKRSERLLSAVAMQCPTLFLRHQFVRRYIMGYFGMPAGSTFEDFRRKYQNVSFYNEGMTDIEEIGMGTSHMLRILDSAFQHLRRLPDNQDDDLYDNGVYGWSRLIHFIQSLPLMSINQVCFKLELDHVAAVWLLVAELHRRGDRGDAQPILQRLTGAMTRDNAGQIYQWAAAVTQPGDRRSRNPIRDAWFNDQLMDRVIACGYVFAEIRKDRGGRHPDQAYAMAHASDGSKIKWVADRNEDTSDLIIGSHALLPTFVPYGTRVLVDRDHFKVCVTKMYRAQLSKIPIGPNRDESLRRQRLVIMNIDIYGNIRRKRDVVTGRCRVTLYRNYGLLQASWGEPYDFNDFGHSGNADGRMTSVGSFLYRFCWVRRLLFQLAKERYCETQGISVSRFRDHDKVEIDPEDLLLFNGAQIEIRNDPDYPSDQIATITGSEMHGREERYRREHFLLF